MPGSQRITLGFKFSTLKTSIGSRIVQRVINTSNGTKYYYDPLNGEIDNIFYSKNYSTPSIILDIKDNLKTYALNKQYDSFKLLRTKYISNNNNDILTRIYDYEVDSENPNRILPRVQKETIKNMNNTLNLYYDYSYDYRGNVTYVKKNGINLRSYTYDYTNKISTENLCDHNNSIAYGYDYNGNLRYKQVFANGVSTPLINNNYLYDVDWPDRLVKFGELGFEKDILYEDKLVSNPTFYGNKINKQGITFTWEGRRLVDYLDNTKNLHIKYTYNDIGLRIKKESIKDNVTSITSYYYEGNKLLNESCGVNNIYYIYDGNDLLYGLIYKNEIFYYIRDILLNIVGIVGISGNIVVEYDYDAFGNLLSTTGTLSSTLGKDNSFIYKGYYYDHETGLYWVSSRYYVPEWCRWLNADDVSFLDSESINGLNLYAYYGNNPVMYIRGPVLDDSVTDPSMSVGGSYSGSFGVLATIFKNLY